MFYCVCENIPVKHTIFASMLNICSPPRMVAIFVSCHLSSWSKRNLKCCLWCVQVQTDISVSSKHQTLQGVAFPLHRDAVEALKRYKDKMINYVQLVSPHMSVCSAPRCGTICCCLKKFRDVHGLTRRGTRSKNKVLNLSLIFHGFVPHDQCTKESLWG